MLAATPAVAHVTVHTISPADDGFVAAAFRVPNEDDKASTVKFEMTFPTSPAIANASTEPVPGWTASIVRDGDRVASITWSGGHIAPGEFQEFPVSMGQLPEGTDTVTFKAVQTYDNGDVVRWIETTSAGGAEPDHPAPALELTPADHGDDHNDNGSPVVAYALAAAALGLSVTALLRTRRPPAA